MSSSLSYDLRRTLTSRSMLLSMLAVVVLSLALIPIITSARSPVSTVSPANAVVLEYSDTAGLHFMMYSFDTFGRPVGGSTLLVIATSISGNQSMSGVTNSSGLLSFLVPSSPSSTYFIFYNITYGGGLSQAGIIKHSNPFPPGSLHALGGGVFAPVVDQSNSSRIDALVVGETLTGQPPIGYQVYYNFTVSTGRGGSDPTSAQGMMSLGTLGAYHQVFALPAIPASARSVNLGMSSPDGAQFSGSTISVASFGVRYFTVQSEQVFAKFTANVFSLVVPVFAILLAYGSYGRDRVTGVLDSVLVRPISKRGLSVSRYSALMIATMLTIGLSILSIDAISLVMIGSTPTFEYSLATFASLSVEAAAFVGISMALSRVIRSAGSLIAISVGLWVFLAFFWEFVVIAFSASLGYDVRSAVYVGISVQSALFNPARFYVVVADYLNKLSINILGVSNLPFNTSSVGITPSVVVATGLVWVVVPFVLFLWLSTRKD